MQNKEEGRTVPLPEGCVKRSAKQTAQQAQCNQTQPLCNRNRKWHSPGGAFQFTALVPIRPVCCSRRNLFSWAILKRWWRCLRRKEESRARSIHRLNRGRVTANNLEGGADGRRTADGLGWCDVTGRHYILLHAMIGGEIIRFQSDQILANKCISRNFDRQKRCKIRRDSWEESRVVLGDEQIQYK